MPIVYQHLGSPIITVRASQTVDVLGQSASDLKIIWVQSGGAVGDNQTAKVSRILPIKSNQSVSVSGSAGSDLKIIRVVSSGIVTPNQTAKISRILSVASSQNVDVSGQAAADKKIIFVGSGGSVSASQTARAKISKTFSVSSSQTVSISGSAATVLVASDVQASDSITDDNVGAIDDGNAKTVRIFNSSGTEIGSGDTSVFTGTSTSIDNSSELRWTNSSGSDQDITDIDIEDSLGNVQASGSIGSYTVADGKDLYYPAGDLTIKELA